MVTSFKYLGHILMAQENDLPAVVGNQRKERKKWVRMLKKWARMLRTLGREGEYVRTSGTFFKAVVEAVLLFGFEKCQLTPRMGRTLVGF